MTVGAVPTANNKGSTAQRRPDIYIAFIGGINKATRQIDYKFLHSKTVANHHLKSHYYNLAQSYDGLYTGINKHKDFGISFGFSKVINNMDVGLSLDMARVKGEIDVDNSTILPNLTVNPTQSNKKRTVIGKYSANSALNLNIGYQIASTFTPMIGLGVLWSRLHATPSFHHHRKHHHHRDHHQHPREHHMPPNCHPKKNWFGGQLVLGTKLNLGKLFVSTGYKYKRYWGGNNKKLQYLRKINGTKQDLDEKNRLKLCDRSFFNSHGVQFMVGINF